MRIVALLAIGAFFWILPRIAGRSVVRSGSPRQLIVLGIVTLGGLMATFVLIAAALIGPSDLAATDLPRVFETCLDAAARIAQHPALHWGNILASVLLLATFAWMLLATVWTMRDARQPQVPGPVLPAEEDRLLQAFGRVPAGVRALDISEPVAYTSGIYRPQIVLSTGLIHVLELPEREAVLAHERGHARAHHLPMLLFARVARRSLGFLPPVRRGVDLLVTGLEMRADESAAEAVGDPVIVARALATLAEHRSTAERRPAAAIHGAAGGVGDRVRRLLGRAPRRPWHGRVLVLAACAAVAILIAVWPASDRAFATESEPARLHTVCHLPHPATPDPE